MSDHAAIVRGVLNGLRNAASLSDTTAARNVVENTTMALAALAALEQELAEAKRERDEAVRWHVTELKEREAAGAALTAAKRKIDACPICSQNVPGPSWRDA